MDERIGMQRNRTGTRASIQTASGTIVSARVKTKVWLELDGRFAVGDGGLRLLREIAVTGSLAAAVRQRIAPPVWRLVKRDAAGSRSRPS